MEGRAQELRGVAGFGGAGGSGQAVRTCQDLPRWGGSRVLVSALPKGAAGDREEPELILLLFGAVQEQELLAGGNA